MFNKKIYTLNLKTIILVVATSLIFGGGLFYLAQKLINIESLSFGNWKIVNINDKQLKEDTFEKDKVQVIKVIGEEEQIIEMVEKVSPAVVSIVATTEVPTFEVYYDDPFSGFGDSFFDNFFDFRIPQRRQNGTKEQKVGAGTGFLVSADGYIITNKHVVDDENAEYTVFLNDEENKGEKIEAKVLARDPNNDLAVLKIEKENLPYLEFGDTENLKVGQNAITIGYALGEFDNTVSRGVISGLSRSITAGGYFGRKSERLKNLIQTDAAINPGNSGGPMLNTQGEVIGVNVAMANGENIGFAIPANLAKEAFLEVKETGTIQEKTVAFLGVRYLPITESLKEKNNLPYDYGVLIARGEARDDLAVIPGSPADIAGIVENDIILEINDEKITTRNQLVDLISKYEPNEEVELKIFHKGDEKKIKVKLGEHKAS